MREIQIIISHVLSTAIAECGDYKYGFMKKRSRPLDVGKVKHPSRFLTKFIMSKRRNKL